MVVAGQSISIYQAETPQIFTDVPPSAYYFDAANLLSGEKVTAGCGTGLYCPTQNVTRAQMAIFIVRTAMGGGPNADNFTYSPAPHFTDVPANAFGFQWIQKMYELGITAGCVGYSTAPVPGWCVPIQPMRSSVLFASVGQGCWT